MNLPAIEEALRRTLDDERVSRSERRALAALLEEEKPDDRELAILRSRAFDIAKEALDASNASRVVDWLEDVTKVLTPQPETDPRAHDEVLFSPGDACVRKITSLLSNARRRVDICVFTITDDRISRAIVDAHRRRISVRVLTDNEKASDLGSDIAQIAGAGIPVAVDESDKHMHHKFAIFDDSVVITGSYNWTRSAATLNEENLVASGDPSLVRAFVGEFEKLWEKFSRHV